MTKEDAILYAVQNVKEGIDAGLRGLQATVNANAEVSNLEFKSLNERLDKMEDRTEKTSIECEKRKEHTETIRKFKKNRIWYLTGIVIFIIMVVVIYDNIGLRGFFHLVDIIK